jgi:hypothetical protein
MRWRLARAAGIPPQHRLTAHDVLSDLIGSSDFPCEVMDMERAAAIIIGRLEDAGFAIVEDVAADGFR